METWSNLCRSCLSSNTEVSFEEDQGVKEKFFETTSIQVRSDDGLPQMLCPDCLNVMNTSYEFRKQCMKMDADLKIQIDSLQLALLEKETEIGDEPTADENAETTVDEINITEQELTIKQLESIIKTEPVDSDDDYYYVVVIDEDNKNSQEIDTEESLVEAESLPEDETITEEMEPAQQQEKTTANVKLEKLDSFLDQNAQDSFENSIDSFIIPDNRVPVNVPATILENEEESQDNDENTENTVNMETAMDVDPHQQDSNSQSEEQFVQLHLDSEYTDANSSEIVMADINDLGSIENVIQKLPLDKQNSLYKKLTNQKYVLKTTDNVTYLADMDSEDPNSQREIILCEGEDSSQFKILNCNASELVIEYSDEGKVATIFQQEDGSYMCTCGEQFTDLEEYEKHEHTHNPGGENLCSLCGKGFESAEILTGHLLLHSVNGMLISCPFCEQLIKRNALTQHIKYSHNNIKPKCSICDKTFANPNNLKRHMMIHTGVREYECDVCQKRFHQKITMQTHKLTHMNPFACKMCDLEFINKSELNNHIESNLCTKSKVLRIKEELIKTVKQEVTSNAGKLLGYGCSLCKRMFSVLSALEQHVESMHMTDPIELLCQECGEVLPSKADMDAHILTHKNVKRSSKRFECSTCGKGCASQAMLMMHERVHTNERPFSCQLCSLKFKTKTHLRTHQLTHTREKKFGCSVCMKFFALKGNLVVHLRTHTGERPYQCGICNESFIDSKYLKKHKLKKHAIDNVPWNVYYDDEWKEKEVA